MSRILLAPEVELDLDRIFDFLFEANPENAAPRIRAIMAAIDILETSPLMGRPLSHGQRELVIATGTSGSLALYCYDALADTAYVLAVRSQREKNHKRATK